MRALVLLAALAGCSSGGVQSDWERQNRKAAQLEEQIELPAFPASANLVEFGVAEADGFHFFVDGTTLGVGKDGVVRYVLVARSPGGVQNVTYEGLRCATGEQRIFAFGRADGSWSLSRSGWRSLGAPTAPQRYLTLYRNYFCPLNEPIRDAGEGLRALQQGGHPFVKGFGRFN